VTSSKVDAVSDFLGIPQNARSEIERLLPYLSRWRQKPDMARAITLFKAAPQGFVHPVAPTTEGSEDLEALLSIGEIHRARRSETTESP